MRMKIPKFKGKHWEFIDHFPDSTFQANIADDTGGTPPPDTRPSRWIPGRQTNRGIRQLFQSQPGPESRCTVSVPKYMEGMKNFKQSLKISSDQHKQRSHQGSQLWQMFSVFRRMAQIQQVIQYTISRFRSHPENSRKHQIKPNGGKHAGKHHQNSGHNISEIVVRNGISGKPAIIGWESFRFQNTVDKHHLHRLFGTGNLRAAKTDGDDQQEGKQKNKLRNKNIRLRLSKPLSDFIPLTIPADSRTDCCETNNQQQTPGIISQQAKRTAQPIQERNQDQSNGTRENKTSSRQFFQKTENDRASDDSNSG